MRGHFRIGEKGLGQGPWRGHAGGLDDHVIEVERAGVALGTKLVQGAYQIAPHAATDAAVTQLDNGRVDAREQLVIDALRRQFVFDHNEAVAMLGLQNTPEQSGLTTAEEAGDDGDGYQIKHS